MVCNILVVVLLSALVCLTSADLHKNSDRSEFKKSLSTNCDDSYSLTCLKLNAVSWVDKLSENEDISVMPGISIVRENNSANVKTGDIVTELAREFPDDPNARLDSFLLKKVTGFLDNHSIKLNLWNAAAESESAGTARKKDKGGKGGGGGMGMMLAVGAMMKGMLMSLGMAALAALAGKALMTSLISLVLSGIVGLKSMSGGGGGHSNYEVHHASSHDGWDGGHGRSIGEAPLPLALQVGYKPTQ